MTLFPENWLKAVLHAIVLSLFIQSVFAANVTEYVDSRLQSYYNDYMFITKTHCRPDQYLSTDNYFISIEDIQQDDKYDPTKDRKTIGECYDTPPYKLIIHVDKKWFEEHDPLIVKSVIFHELRHCLFGLANADHSKDPNNYFAGTLSDNIDEQVLYKQVIDDIKKSCESP